MIFTPASVVLSLVTFFLSIILVPTAWGERRTRKPPFNELEKGLKEKYGIVNNNPVLKKLEPQTERNYQKKLDLWDQ
jgi:hypothetical protein